MGKIGRNELCPCGSGKKYKKCCMSEITIKTHIRLEKLRINGFAAGNALQGEQSLVLVRAGLTSDEPEFYVYMKNIGNFLAGKAKELGAHLSIDRASSLLLITHADGSADLYVHDIPMMIEILAKKDIAAGDLVYQSGIADVRRIRLPGIELKPDDGILFCFKVGWKFGLFFDLHHESSLDVEGMEKNLGNLYRLLSFEEAYAALGDPSLFSTLVQAGWFPFVELIGGDFERLAKAHNTNFNVKAEEDILLNKFNNERIDAIANRWWKRPGLSGRKTILQPALDAYKRKDPVPCLKIILTEIEGIIQDSHIVDKGSGANIKELLMYASKKGLDKSGEASLLFPKEFLAYLSDYTFAHFDPKNPKAGVMSRHSTGHGGATPEAYTQPRALQAILTLDQLAFYL